MNGMRESITNRSGKQIPLIITKPDVALHGTFVVMHGLGGWQEQGIVTAMRDAVVHEGYVAVTFDAADGAKAPDSTPRTSTTTGYLADLEDVVAHIEAQDWFVPPLSLAGHSQGGLIALTYASAHPVARVIVAASALSWKTYTKFVVPLGFFWYVKGFYDTPGPSGTTLRLGRSWLLDFIRYDGLLTAKRVSVPTLVISAGKDNLVGRKRTHERLARALPSATHVCIEGAPHTFAGHERTVADTITKWLTSS